jgi:hypothetical protein
LSEFVCAQSHSVQPLWACQSDQKKQDSANQPELRVLEEYPGLHREFDIFTEAARLQMATHDSADGRRSLLDPKERHGTSLSEEVTSQFGRFQSRDECEVSA